MKVGRVARLSGFPVDLEPHVQVVRVFDLVRSREKGTERSKGIATFSFYPLPAMLELKGPFAVVVVQGVSREVIKGVGFFGRNWLSCQ